jgi:hypothetical protein
MNQYVLCHVQERDNRLSYYSQYLNCHIGYLAFINYEYKTS